MRSLTKTFIFCFILLFSINFILIANYSNADIIEIDSPIYQLMDILYSVNDIGTPSNSRPWSKAEAKLILSRIDKSNLNENSRNIYNSIEKEILNTGRFNIDDEFILGLELDVNLENYSQTNPSYSETESDWVYDFEKRKKLLVAKIEMGIDNWFYTYCDLCYGWGLYDVDDDIANYKFTLPTDEDYEPYYTEGVENTHKGFNSLLDNYYSYYDSGTVQMATTHSVYQEKSISNIPPASKYFDFNWPKRTIFSFGGNNWNLSVNKDKISWGNSHIGNLVVDNHFDYQNFLRFTGFSDKFKYEFLAINMNTKILINEEQETPYQRLFLAHRLEFRIAKKLTFAVSENVMYQEEILDFSYLNPANIYHNVNTRGTLNAIAHAEIDWQFLKGFNLYVQGVLDQARAPNEGDSQTGSWGALTGLEYSSLVGSGLFTTSLEAVYTTPLLYRRDIIDFIVLTREISFFHNETVRFDYLGFPYGGDDLCFQWDANYYLNENTSFHGFIRANYHGQFYIDDSPNINNIPLGDANRRFDTLLSGDIIDETFTFSIKGETIIFKKYPYPKVWTEIDFLIFRKANKNTGEITDKKQNIQIILGMSVNI